MSAIDRVEFQISQATGLALAVMVGFLVFAVALDLKAAHFRHVLARPLAPGVGLVAQLVMLPAVAFGVGALLADTPSVAIGLLLVTCCPGGALSNYLTGVAGGDVATSISMTAVSTLVSIVATPLLFGLWVSARTDTAAVVEAIDVDPRRIVLVLLVMLVAPVCAGMMIRARRPRFADATRVWVRRTAMLVFATVVTVVVGSNLRLILDHGGVALLPVVTTFLLAAGLGWTLARAARLQAPTRRAVVFEVAMQNVALAIAMAVAFFPTLAGVAVTSALWGVVHIVLGFPLAWAWRSAASGPQP